MKKNDYYAVDGLIDSISMIKTMAVLYNQEVGIHTFELKSDFQTAKGESQLQQVWNVLKAGKLQGKRLIRLTNGLWAEMIYPIREEWSQPFLKIVVNPRVLVDGQEGYLGITDLDTLERCIRTFEDFWKGKGIEMPINMCSISRVDLCMNLQMDQSFWVEGYIDLLKRTPHDRKYKLCKFFDSDVDRHYVGFTNNSRRLCVYDKAYEQRRFSRARASQCPNLMRVELQLYRPGIRKVIDEQQSVENIDRLRYMVLNAPRILCQGIYAILPGNPYMDPKSVWQRVELHTELRSQTKAWMKELINQLWQADTYDEVADQWENSILRKVRNDFVKIGVSPAAIRGNTQTRFLPCLSAMVTYVLKESGKLI